MSQEPNIQTPITYEWEAVSTERMRSLAKATASDHVKGMPPTYPTIYRWGEFEWLKRSGVDLRNLLHTDQEYEYLAPLVVGDKPKVTTTLKGMRARAGMTFISLESTIESGGRIAVRNHTQFVVKGVVGAKP